MKHIGLTTLFAALSAVPLTPAAAQDLLWARQFGSLQQDYAWSVAAGGDGHVYIAGETYGNLIGPNIFGLDAFLVKYDALGTVVWTRQFGTDLGDVANGIAVDSAGSAYITGYTNGSLGGLNAGTWDIFLAKFDASGAPLWARQIGTPVREYGYGVAADSAGNAYITGFTEGNLAGLNAGGDDAFLTKYDASGVMLWTRQFGSSKADRGFGVAVDSGGNAYVSGETWGSLSRANIGLNDAFLTKYDASGNLLWTRQFGTQASDQGTGVAVDSADRVYVSGFTTGDFSGQSAGREDAFLAKYDASGVMLWTRQVGTRKNDRAWGVAVDSAGGTYIAGDTWGSLGGHNAGREDAFVAKYNASGALLWTRQTGTSLADLGFGVAVNSTGNAYVAGHTEGSLGGPNPRGFDCFLVKYGEAPCYADCDKSTGNGVLDVFDFLCFQNSFVNGETYACDCDTSTGNGVCDVFDFLCFQDAFVAGCP